METVLEENKKQKKTLLPYPWYKKVIDCSLVAYVAWFNSQKSFFKEKKSVAKEKEATFEEKVYFIVFEWVIDTKLPMKKVDCMSRPH